MYKTDLNIRSSYKKYATEVKNPLEKKDFISLANLYMKFLFNKVIQGETVTLPAKLGTLSITGTKKKLKYNKDGIPLLPPNWGATKKLWKANPQAELQKKIVYCLNEETNGVVYKVNWSRNRVPIENKIYYALIMTRHNKRAIHQAIKSGKEYLIKNT